MRAVVTQATRVFGDNSYSLHPGDILEGTDAAVQVALGNAEAIPDEEPSAPAEAPAEVAPDVEAAPPAEPESESPIQEAEDEVGKLTDALKQDLEQSGKKGA